MHGSMSIKQRQAALNSFRKSTRNHGDRVLILSAVGLVGLNLACANIMIIVVRDSTPEVCAMRYV